MKNKGKITIELEGKEAEKAMSSNNLGLLFFALDDIDDRMAHLRAVKATNMANVLFEITHNLRKEMRHAGHGSENEGVNAVFERIHELLEEQHVDVDELIR